MRGDGGIAVDTVGVRSVERVEGEFIGEDIGVRETVR